MAFFRPVRSAKRGTMPAGMVLVVVVMALVASMFLSADSINRKAAGRRNNSEMRRSLAEKVVAVSDGLKIDAPAKAFDDWVSPYVNHERKTDQVGSDDVLAQRRAREAEIRASAGASPASTTPPGDPNTTLDPTAPPTAPPTTVDPRPKLRVPTPDNPLKLWVGGDSISYEPGIAVQNIAAQTKLFNVVTDARPSTGLTRPDYFNWPQHLDRDVVPLDGGGIDPDVVMIMFGGNDAQNIPAYAPEGNEVAVLGTPEWQAQYRKRVADTMDLLRSPKDDRLVMWLGSPIMGPNTVRHLDQLDYIFYTEAIKRPWVVYFDSWAFFTDGAGNYAKSLPALDGKPHVMRANDNIHFSALGGDRLATAAYAKLGTLVDLSAAPYAPDPDKAPPPEVVERPEVPPGDGSVPI
jgi:hypothetical protein